MPYKRRYRKRRKYKRRRGKRNMVRVPRAMITPNGIKKFKLTDQFTAITSPAGFFEGTFNLHSMSQAYNSNSTTTPLAVSAVGNITGLFDFYKVTGIKIEYLPNYKDPQQSLSVLSSNGEFGPNPNFLCATDNDNVGSLTTNDMYEKDSLKIKSPFRRWRTWIKPMQMIQGLDASGVGIPQHGWLNLQRELNMTVGIHTIRSDQRFTDDTNNVLASLPIGQFLVSYYVSVKTRN